jgi:hypothetical protein
VTEKSASSAGDPVIKIANEFTEVEVDRVQTRNGMRLRIFVPSSGRRILLCPLELEALTWQDHGLFSYLLATPGGPAEPPGGSPDGDPGAAG